MNLLFIQFETDWVVCLCQYGVLFSHSKSTDDSFLRNFWSTLLKWYHHELRNCEVGFPTRVLTTIFLQLSTRNPFIAGWIGRGWGYTWRSMRQTRGLPHRRNLLQSPCQMPLFCSLKKYFRAIVAFLWAI